jgi:hypothetical protein
MGNTFSVDGRLEDYKEKDSTHLNRTDKERPQTLQINETQTNTKI